MHQLELSVSRDLQAKIDAHLPAIAIRQNNFAALFCWISLRLHSLKRMEDFSHLF